MKQQHFKFSNTPIEIFSTVPIQLMISILLREFICLHKCIHQLFGILNNEFRVEGFGQDEDKAMFHVMRESGYIYKWFYVFVLLVL